MFPGDILVGMLNKCSSHLSNLSRGSSSNVAHQVWDWFQRGRQILILYVVVCK